MMGYNDYYYEYDYVYDEAMFELLAGIVGFLLVFVMIAAVVGLVMYILQAAGTYSIAKRRGIKHAWMAWVPVLYYWIVGCIADQYRYVAKGQVKNRRTALLVLAVISAALGSVTSVLSVSRLFGMVEQMAQNGGQSAPGYGMMLGSTIGINLVIGLISGGGSIALLVLWCISLYDLYTSCDPKNNVLFLVLGIIFSFLNPIFIFANRNKDGGMPPRRRPQPVREMPREPEWKPADPPAEPWENSEEQ